MDDRSLKILLALIREFIATGEPISSKELYDNYDFGIKPASIRAELLRLAEEGFIAQPHTSGGRVPTEHGYEFFVNQIIGDIFSKTMGGFLSLRTSLLEELLHHKTPEAVHGLANELKTLTIGYEPRRGSIYKSGLDELCERLDISHRDEFLEIIHDFERLNDRLKNFASDIKSSGKGSDAPQVYIGKKSPFTDSSHLSVIVDNYEIDGEPLMLIAVGPKRMDYKKSLKVFKIIRDRIKNKK